MRWLWTAYEQLLIEAMCARNEVGELYVLVSLELIPVVILAAVIIAVVVISNMVVASDLRRSRERWLDALDSWDRGHMKAEVIADLGEIVVGISEHRSAGCQKLYWKAAVYRVTPSQNAPSGLHLTWINSAGTANRWGKVAAMAQRAAVKYKGRVIETPKGKFVHEYSPVISKREWIAKQLSEGASL